MDAIPIPAVFFRLSGLMGGDAAARALAAKAMGCIRHELSGRALVAQLAIEETTLVIPHVARGNETDWAFLKRRAERIGFEEGPPRQRPRAQFL